MPFDTRNNAFEYSSPFTFSNEPNLIITNLGLFEEENHTKNSILLDKIFVESNETAPEKMPYAQSDWNSAQRSDYTSILYDMVYTNSLNTVSSRDIELLRAPGTDHEENIAMVLAEYSQRQYSQISNTVEQYLIDALFGLKVESQYAGQGNIDFLAGNAKTSYVMNVANTANVFEQLDEVNRIINVKLGSGLAKKRKGTVILAAGNAAKALKYHQSIKDYMVYTLSLNDSDNFATKIVSQNPAFSSWKLDSVHVIDVTGYTEITDYIGENGFAVVPMVDGGFKLHTGIGVRHSRLGREPGLVHQYMTDVDRMGWPAIHTESAFLPQVNIPDSIVFGSISS
ncbi:TPA: major capsid protein [Klebsiella oxytoca]